MPYCYNCFREHAAGTGPCPHCGYDPAADGGKYPFALPHGSILAGQFITGRVLGQGGFGITYLALDNRLKTRVAIKEFMPDSMAVRTAGAPQITVYTGQRQENFQYGMERFLDEAKVLARFQENPNIVGVRSYFEENGTAYFVMEYVEGASLKSYIQEHGGRISWEEAVRLLTPVMDALGAVHKEGIIHRDVTPDNIFITANGGVKLLDFGSARYSLGDKSRSLDVVLKAGYAPKEQYTRRGRQGPYTDVYSLAACFYSAITGYLPPESLDRADEDDLVLPSTRGIEIPQAVEDVLLKGLEVQPADRYQSMEEFRSALDRAAAESGEEPEAEAEESRTEPEADSSVEVKPEPETPCSPEDAGKAVREARTGGQESASEPKPPPSYRVKYGILAACCVAAALIVAIAGTFHSPPVSPQISAGPDRGMAGQPTQVPEDSGAGNEADDTDIPNVGSEEENSESIHPENETEKKENTSQEQSTQVSTQLPNAGSNAENDSKPAEEPANKTSKPLNYVTDQEYSIAISYLIKTLAEPSKEAAVELDSLEEERDSATVDTYGLPASQGRLLLLTARASELKSTVESVKQNMNSLNMQREIVQQELDYLKEGASETQELRGMYTGEWNDGKPNGQGTFTVSTKSAYQGVWEGTWKNGAMTYGVCQYSTGNRYEGSLSGGSPGGTGVMVYQNGDRFEGNWEGGMRHGDGTMKYANGESLTTSWYHDSDTSAIKSCEEDLQRIERLQKQLEAKKNQLETQLQAVESELEQVDKQISDNVEGSFQYFE